MDRFLRRLSPGPLAWLVILQFGVPAQFRAVIAGTWRPTGEKLPLTRTNNLITSLQICAILKISQFLSLLKVPHCSGGAQRAEVAIETNPVPFPKVEPASISHLQGTFSAP
jgi:hypothetical protein